MSLSKDASSDELTLVALVLLPVTLPSARYIFKDLTFFPFSIVPIQV